MVGDGLIIIGQLAVAVINFIRLSVFSDRNISRL